MEMSKLKPILWNLKPNEKRLIYTGIDGTKVFVVRTDKLTPHDFAVSLLIPGRKEFRPTHVRLLFDLYLKRLTNPVDSFKIFLMLERVYEGEDPEKLVKKIINLKFPMQLDNPDVTLYYAQLLMIEQDFNFIPSDELHKYLVKVLKKKEDGTPTLILARIENEEIKKKVSNVNPPREFLMRFIRWVASGDSEIDPIITVAVRRKPASEKYAKKMEEILKNIDNF